MNELHPIEHLLIVEDQQGKRTVVLESATCSIGRDDTNFIVLDSPWISRHHATLLRVTMPKSSNHVFRLIDGDLQGERSTNGFSVNGQPCLSHNLKHGDEIVFGGDVRARYYATAIQADIKYLVSEQAENMSGFLSKLSNPFRSLTETNENGQNFTEAALERLASFPELIPNPIIEVDLEGKITYLNPAAIAQFPTLQKETLQHPLLAGLIPIVENDQNSANYLIREVAIGEQVFEESVYYFIASGLIRIYVVDITKRKQAEALLQKAHNELEIKVEARTSELAAINQSLKAEIVERKRAEQESRLLQTITQAITEAPNFEAAIEVTLKMVCETIGANYAEAWIPESENKVLQLSPAWYRNAETLLPFRVASEKCTFPLSVGLPGRVWASKQPEWNQDVSAQPEKIFLRAKVAQEAGLKTALGVPIVANELVIAICVFFTFKLRKQDKRMVELVQSVVNQLGLMIERKRAEGALLSSMATNRALLNAIPDLLFRISREGIFVNFKAAKDERVPLFEHEFLGKHLYEVLPSEVAQPTLNCVQRALETGEVQILECQLPVQNKLRDYEVRIAVSAENETMAIVRDITKRKQSEQMLQKQERQLKGILNNIPDVAWLKDCSGKYLAVNEPFSEVCGVNLDDLPGMTDWELWSKELAEKYCNDDLEVMTSGQRKRIEEHLIDKEGQTIWLETVKTPIYNENHQVFGTTGIARNITQRKQIEENMRNALEKEKQLNELKSRFVSMTSHEFRTPLATILSSAELLEHYSHKWSDEKKLGHLQRIQTAVKHMTGLLNDVLLIGKAEAGKLEFKPTPLDLKHFCQEMVEEVQLSAKNHEIIFNLKSQCSETCEPEKFSACLDQKLLRHILSNLLSNAIKYSPEGDRVYFDLICQSQEVTFRIRDEGIGIPPAEQERLFNSFHRASNVGSISGTGLGLAIVKNSVDLHGGEIRVESQEGVGTTFIVTLPYGVLE